MCENIAANGMLGNNGNAFMGCAPYGVTGVTTLSISPSDCMETLAVTTCPCGAVISKTFKMHLTGESDLLGRKHAFDLNLDSGFTVERIQPFLDTLLGQNTLTENRH